MFVCGLPQIQLVRIVSSLSSSFSSSFSFLLHLHLNLNLGPIVSRGVLLAVHVPSPFLYPGTGWERDGKALLYCRQSKQMDATAKPICAHPPYLLRLSRLFLLLTPPICFAA